MTAIMATSAVAGVLGSNRLKSLLQALHPWPFGAPRRTAKASPVTIDAVYSAAPAQCPDQSHPRRSCLGRGPLDLVKVPPHRRVH